MTYEEMAKNIDTAKKKRKKVMDEAPGQEQPKVEPFNWRNLFRKKYREYDLPEKTKILGVRG
jgi:hypothetical protein